MILAVTWPAVTLRRELIPIRSAVSDRDKIETYLVSKTFPVTSFMLLASVKATPVSGGSLTVVRHVWDFFSCQWSAHWAGFISSREGSIAHQTGIAVQHVTNQLPVLAASLYPLYIFVYLCSRRATYFTVLKSIL